MSKGAATPVRPRSLSHESYLIELSSQKINDKKHTDRLRNCLFINRVYELALEEEDEQRRQRQMRKRSVNFLKDPTSKRLCVEEELSGDDESDTTEEEDLNNLSDSDEHDEDMTSPPPAEPLELRAVAESDEQFLAATAAL
jgi:hypothetical protein